jgi:hypothetical protein
MRQRLLVFCLSLGLAAAATAAHAAPIVLAQASSIEVRKPSPDSSPEVLVNGKPARAVKPEAKKPDAKKSETKKSEAKKPEAKQSKASGMGFGEVRVADRALTVRAARDKDSEFRKVLKPGQPVRVDYAQDGWFAVFDPDETVRDMSRAWGFCRDKYLVAPKDYVPAPVEPEPQRSAPDSAKDSAKAKAGDAAVGYSVVERKADKRKPQHITLRVRVDMAEPPAKEAMRKIVREIWKSERKKNEVLQLEVLLSGMDAHGLAYAVAKFHDDGRISEFWWRDVVVGKPHK